MNKIKIFLSVIVLLGYFSSCTNNNKTGTNSWNSSSASNVVKNDESKPTVKDEAYYKSKGYQVFPEFQFAVKCPAILEDISKQSNDDFDFNYAGGTDDTFYQIMIIKIPAGRLDYSKEEYQEFLQGMFGSARGGGRTVLWGDENLPAFLIDDYIQQGHNGRGIAVVRNGKVYTFNVITKGNLETTFNNFTNNVIFLDKLNEPTGQKYHSEVEDLGQETYQTFASAGFRVKCNCNLFLNTTFMDRAKQQGVNNIIAAYACAENEDDPAIGTIININIYDVSEDYKAIPESEYSRLAEMVLKQYASQLSNSGITNNYTYTTYQGVQALEYTFDQMGLPTKAIIFHKNKKSYLLQVGTRNNLAAKYTSLKNNFEVI